MNSVNMQILSFIIIDNENQNYFCKWVICVPRNYKTLWLCIYVHIRDNPLAWLLLTLSLKFLSPLKETKWFPNITWKVDSYHFYSPSNKTNVLKKDFGLSNWAILRAITNLRLATIILDYDQISWNYHSKPGMNSDEHTYEWPSESTANVSNGS